jgi:hypothetical protein
VPGADIDSDHNLLVATICTSLKKIIRFHKRKPRWDLEKLYAQRQKVHDSLEEKLGAIKYESGNVEVQCKNIKKCVLDTMSDLIGKVERRASHGLYRRCSVKWMNEGNGRMSTTKKEELQKTEERIEKSHGKRQEGISGDHMRRNHRISKNRTL